MKARLLTKVLILVSSAAGLCMTLGCGSASTAGRIEARIKEKPEVFAKLTSQQQKDIKWGYVKRGFTPDMVYMAFGAPEQIVKSTDETSYVWVYLDRSAINQDAAMASALQAGASADSGGGGKFSSSNANFKGSVTSASLSASDAYSLIDINGGSSMPTIWVAFTNNEVVNVRQVQPGKSSDKSGSLGGS